MHDYSKEEEQKRISQCKDLYNYIHKEVNADIYTPNIVFSECLQGVDIGNHQEVERILKDKTTMLQFCNKSAKMSAEIAIKYKEYKESNKNHHEDSGDKKHIKADIKILATAEANNIDELYTYDKDLVKISKSYSSLQNKDKKVEVILINDGMTFSHQATLLI